MADTQAALIPIVSRREAMARGLKRYFTGKPCRRGHLSERDTMHRRCFACDKITRGISVKGEAQKEH